MSQTFILKIGGSLISPSQDIKFDFKFARELKKLLLEFPDVNFVLNAGGGQTARYYIDLLRRHHEHDEVQIHYAGMAASVLNAHLLTSQLDLLVHPAPVRVDDVDQINFDTKRVWVVVANRPGVSNDWNAVEVAKYVKAKRVISLKNVAGVFSEDPKKNSAATLVPQLSWNEYSDIIGDRTTHVPGASYPVDPIAAEDARTAGVEFVIMSGDLSNLKKALQGEEFLGSVIS